MSYYVVGSVVEVVLLLAVAVVAWTWPPPFASRHTAGQDELHARLSS